jgi:hypothetical protein
VTERPALAFAAGDVGDGGDGGDGGDEGDGGPCTLDGEPWVVQDDVRFAPGTDTRVSSARALVDARRRVLASAEGSIYVGYRVHLQTVAADGAPIGEAVGVPHEGSAIAEPSIAIDGVLSRGVLSFVESSGHGFRRLAVRFDCSGAR